MNSEVTRRRWIAPCVAFAALLALAAAWTYSPLTAWTKAVNVTAWAHDAGARPWVPIVVLAAYTPASMALFPRALITLFAVVAFGPWLGFAFAFTGIMIAAIATYALGVGLDCERLRALAGPRLDRVRALLCRRGVLAVTVVRLVPIAPFALVNAVAGALRIRLSHFAVGSALGILPGTAASTVLGDQIAAALRAPGSVNLYIVAAALLVLVAATLGVRRWLFGRWKAR
jgi:uncharacterized membrane protein YdjX (TVP38/TMEM64 family)